MFIRLQQDFQMQKLGEISQEDNNYKKIIKIIMKGYDLKQKVNEDKEACKHDTDKAKTLLLQLQQAECSFKDEQDFLFQCI